MPTGDGEVSLGAIAVGDGEVEAIFRSESGGVIATLIRQFRSIDLAEEAVQDAFVIALERWSRDGLPANPGGWITTTARNRAINVLRRESTRGERHTQAMDLYHRRDDEGGWGPWHGPALPDTGPGPLGEEAGPMADDRLRLIFTCC